MLDTPFSFSAVGFCDRAASPTVAVRGDDFIVGAENRAAWGAARKLLDSGIGPLVICGPSGSGKTHLAEAIVEAWRIERPHDEIVVASGAEFAERYAAAVAADRVASFRNTFRTCALAVIDGLQHTATKPTAQSELLHTLDALARNGGALVVTVDALPTKCEALLPALVGRLLGGTVVGLAPPGVESRRCILARFVERRGWSVDSRVLDALAADLETSVPTLTGTLLAAAAAAAHENRPLDVAFLRRRIQQREPWTIPTLKTIAARTARRYGLTLSDLKGQSRRRSIVAARDAAIALARRLTNLSLQEIGAYFGGRDHTTVLHSCRKWETTLTTDTEAAAVFHELRRDLTQF